MDYDASMFFCNLKQVSLNCRLLVGMKGQQTTIAETKDITIPNNPLEKLQSINWRV